MVAAYYLWVISNFSFLCVLFNMSYLCLCYVSMAPWPHKCSSLHEVRGAPSCCLTPEGWQSWSEAGSQGASLGRQTIAELSPALDPPLCESCPVLSHRLCSLDNPPPLWLSPTFPMDMHCCSSNTDHQSLGCTTVTQSR